MAGFLRVTPQRQLTYPLRFGLDDKGSRVSRLRLPRMASFLRAQPSEITRDTIMGYISESSDFGEYGCGSDCSCSGCRGRSTLGEIYIPAEGSQPTRSQPKGGPVSSVGECPCTFPQPRRLTQWSQAMPQNPAVIKSWIPGKLGDPPLSKRYEPWRVRLGLRVPPQHLRFLNLNQFNWNQASLTPRLLQMVRHLAEHVRLSWKSMRPIGFIRLIGHTDDTGQEQYNVDLGNRRAQAVKTALENILKDDILKGRVRIAISVEKSPGIKEPTADNRTKTGRALNRRVEVFLAPPMAAPPSPPPPPPPPPRLRLLPRSRNLPTGRLFLQAGQASLSNNGSTSG